VVRKSTPFRADFVYFTCLKSVRECTLNLLSEGLLRKKHRTFVLSRRTDPHSIRSPAEALPKKLTVFAALHIQVQCSVSEVSGLRQSTKKNLNFWFIIIYYIVMWKQWTCTYKSFTTLYLVRISVAKLYWSSIMKYMQEIRNLSELLVITSVFLFLWKLCVSHDGCNILFCVWINALKLEKLCS
jgi:hypothetical protein